MIEANKLMKLLHGEKVAFGILASLMLTNRSPELIQRIYEFCFDIGLPVCLADLGITSYDDDYLMIAVKRMMVSDEFVSNEPVAYGEQDCLSALKAADEYGNAMRSSTLVVPSAT